MSYCSTTQFWQMSEMAQFLCYWYIWVILIIITFIIGMWKDGVFKKK